jgi:hypothetical protein
MNDVVKKVISPLTAISAPTSLVKEGMDKAIEKLVPDVPTPPKPKVAPVADDLARRRAGARAASRKQEGAGRAGTMLTGAGSKLG